MYNFDAKSIPVLSHDSRAAIAAADDALLCNAQMFSTIIQTARTSDLPINVTQDLYRSMIDGAAKFLDGREQIQRSLKAMHNIVRNSNHAEKMEGCPDGNPRFAQLDNRPSAVSKAKIAV